MRTKILLLFFFILISTATASALEVKVEDGSGAVGGNAVLSVTLRDAQNLGSMDLVLSYDPEILKVVNVEKGSLVKGLFSSNTEQAGVIAIGIVDSKGINGDGEIARITFEVLKKGESPIEFVDVKAYDVETHVDLKVTSENGIFRAEEGTAKEQKKSPGFEIGFAVLALMIILTLIWRRKT